MKIYISSRYFYFYDTKYKIIIKAYDYIVKICIFTSSITWMKLKSTINAVRKHVRRLDNDIICR